jgi:two-component system sensor histidine kinase KdpD
MHLRQIISTRRIAESILAILLTAITTGVLFLLRDVLSTPVVALIYLLPVLLSAVRWGLGPGIMASVCAFLSFNYFFIMPFYTLTVHQTQDFLALAIFLIVAVVISQLVGRIRSSLANVQAREQEVSQLYNLTTALVGLRGIDRVAERLAEDLRNSLRATACRVVLNPEVSASGKIAASPQDAAPEAPANRIFPLRADRGKLGEIQLWLDRAELSDSDERLLRTFAGQGALALERALLAQADTKAAILEESDHLKSALLSSVSHELRTPLVTIKAAATSLLSGEVAWESAAREELLAALEEETDRLNELVGNLLNMSRIEAGALNLEREWNVLSEIVDDAQGRLKRAFVNHHLEVNVPEDLPMVQVDPILVQQVFTNLLNNSVKYAPPGTTIRIHAADDGRGALLVEVTNEGPPIPPEHLKSIFDRFHRVTAADRIPGIGLGLSICKGIIEAHGGHIWAENLPHGMAFKFTLPKKAARATPELPRDRA